MHNTIYLTLGSMIGAVATYFLQKYGFSAVIACCLVGLLGAFFEKIFNIPTFAAVVFMGAFIGMTSIDISKIHHIVIAGGIGGIIFIISSNFLEGHGGRLGAIALISVVISFTVVWIIEKLVFKI